MDLSFREKSLWLMFATLIASFGFYFLTVLPPSAADVVPQQVVLFVVAVVLLVIMQVVGHILIAVVDRRADTDERDRLSSLSGNRLSQVHRRPTSSYSGGRSSRSSSDGARPRITEPMRRKVHGSLMRRMGCQKCLTMSPAMLRRLSSRPSVVRHAASSTSAANGSAG